MNYKLCIPVKTKQPINSHSLLLPLYHPMPLDNSLCLGLQVLMIITECTAACCGPSDGAGLGGGGGGPATGRTSLEVALTYD
jgi:hypothetical protein